MIRFIAPTLRCYASIAGFVLTCCSSFAEKEAIAAHIEPQTRWTMINVSPGETQADCHLIELPDGRKVLIDIADAADAPGKAIGYLRSHNITRIDLVVISHFHKDHYGCLPDLVSAGINIGRVVGNMPAPDATLTDSEMPWGFDRKHAESVLQILREKNIPYFTPKAGERLIETALPDGGIAALDVVCLYDGANTPIGKTHTNDTSIIVRLTHGPCRALFTGDLTSNLGQWLARSNFDLAADILKVPHHGADWGGPTAFFDRVNAKAALVPAPAVLWRSPRDRVIRNYLVGHNTPTYVSGIDGNVTVTMTMQGYSIETEHGGQKPTR